MAEQQEGKAVLLPGSLYDLIEGRARDTGFTSVDEYVEFVLNEVVSGTDDEEGVALDEEESEEVRKRLKALGYLE